MSNEFNKWNKIIAGGDAVLAHSISPQDERFRESSLGIC